MANAQPVARPLFRRRPTQARAQVKVCAILDAADALVGETSSERLIMRDVARRASVKPATLYDYFPTKESLLRALEDRAWARAAEGAERSLSPDPAVPLGDAIAALVARVMLDMASAAARYGLTPESPFGPDRRQRVGAHFAAIAARALGERGGDVRPANLELRLHIATEAVAMLTWVGARDHHEALHDGSYGREVGRLIAHYLVRDQAVSATG